MKKFLVLLAVIAALLLTVWGTYRATMRSLQIEMEGSTVYVTAFGLTDAYEMEGES